VQVQDHLSESTRISYQGHIELYLIPHLGSVPLEELSTDMIEAVYRHLLTVGLAATTVRRINATLSSSLSAAVREGIISTNPAQRVRSRKSNAFHARVWSVDQAATFIRHAEGDDLYLLWRLALVTGLRRGELLGLRAYDIEPSTSSVTIRQNRVVVSGRIVTKTPKTQRSRRIIVVDSFTAELLAKEKKSANDEDLIFTTGEGGGLDPGWVSRRFKQLVVTYGLPVIRFHDLRHTSATLGLSRGESVKEISARLGHSSTAFTEDLYLQVPTSVARRAAQGLADLLDHQATGGAA
jgi:integrase